MADQRLDISTVAPSMTLTAQQPRSAATEIAEIAETTSANCIATRIRQLSRIITRVYDDALRPLGITVSQFTLLSQLAQQNGVSAVEIGVTLDIEKSTLSRSLERLLALGLILTDPPAGRRGRGLHLTPKGQALIKEAYPVWHGAQQTAVRVMGPDSRTILDGLLRHAEKLAAA
jgi:DNA-binding MarR family transcriptional regulator